ncbi:metallophosphoesterase family protein [Oceanospirillum linum]|nr:metallophosphoesterase family protein [Oceanospirillum linum]SEF89881.1 Calcineurin-like phosphoesterase superfamily domain-containing protein [Oleiphilus messinensis]SMP13517.1 Calcineurin-like phosphoesterase superfamily domain-containing protein [Oceanospirillum linum]
MTIKNFLGAVNSLDLGCLDKMASEASPILIFGGPYSNLAATEAIERAAQQRNIPPQQIICTGDIIAYCADAAETTSRIQRWGIPVVMGNCEESIAEGAMDCGCGFDEGSACSLLSISWYNYALKQVSDDARQWMGQLPRNIRFTLQGRNFHVIHGGVEQINRFIFADSDASLLEEEMAMTDADVVIGGHCGIPFARRIGERHWLNAGVIGMPANDGTADSWYMLITPGPDAIKVSWHRLSYPAEASQQAMTDAGLNTPYREALASGLWPSVDLLPESQKAVTGQRLELADYLI